jgi:PASTA domain
MTARIPRLVVIVAIVALGGGGLTFAATQSLAPSAPATPTTPLVQKNAVLVVPDVTNQAFVFAKGALQDAGFSWRVKGGVRGYPANKVVSQSIPSGTRVLDNGAPLVTLTLSRNAKYPQEGAPEDISPYRSTNAVLADAAGQPLAPAVKPTTTPATPAPAPTATTAPAATTPAAPTATAPAPAATTPATPATTTASTPAAPATTSAYPQDRPPAFSVAGAPKEPTNEMPLVDRAHVLGRWLSSHQKPTDANVKHWLYQNEWIVTGARFGWWHGREALQALIQVDRRAVAQWGIGSKSEAVAAGALAEVEARSH